MGICCCLLDPQANSYQAEVFCSSMYRRRFDSCEPSAVDDFVAAKASGIATAPQVSISGDQPYLAPGNVTHPLGHD